MRHNLLLVFAGSSLFSLFALIGWPVYSQAHHQNFAPALMTDLRPAQDAGLYPTTICDKNICTVSTEGSFFSRLFGKSREKEKESLAKVQMQNLVQGLLTYAADNNTFPSSDQGLKALFEKPVLGEIPANWNGPYLQGSLPKDAWNKPFIYEGTRDSFTLTSYGKSGKAAGGTSIICTQNGCQ